MVRAVNYLSTTPTHRTKHRSTSTSSLSTSRSSSRYKVSSTRTLFGMTGRRMRPVRSCRLDAGAILQHKQYLRETRQMIYLEASKRSAQPVPPSSDTRLVQQPRTGQGESSFLYIWSMLLECYLRFAFGVHYRKAGIFLPKGPQCRLFLNKYPIFYITPRS